MTWFENAKIKLESLKLPPGVAGHHVTTKVPTCHSNQTIGEVKRELIENIQNFKSINYVYVLSKNDNLVGVFSFSELFKNKDDTKITKVMVTPVIVSQPQVKQNRVAHLALKHNLKSIPIVDKNNLFFGIVASDHIHKILYKEYRQDLLKSVGIVTPHGQTEDTLNSPIITSYLHRVPWILIGILGGIAVSKIIGLFEETLSTNIILASFIPLIVYVSSAVGTQTQTLFIRDLAFHSKLPLLKYVAKHSLITFLMALTSSLLVTGVLSLLLGQAYLGFVIGLAIFVSISSSALIAIAVPYTLILFNQDPANGSGPFATIIQDATSTFIYFMIATLLL
ncbi:MAG: magnesium transporter [Candidatus Pacebacteria bacterium]|nr:magnesium transporter [Candidatus Paceibacterota bacterium]